MNEVIAAMKTSLERLALMFLIGLAAMQSRVTGNRVLLALLTGLAAAVVYDLGVRALLALLIGFWLGAYVVLRVIRHNLSGERAN